MFFFCAFVWLLGNIFVFKEETVVQWPLLHRFFIVDSRVEWSFLQLVKRGLNYSLNMCLIHVKSVPPADPFEIHCSMKRREYKRQIVNSVTYGKQNIVFDDVPRILQSINQTQNLRDKNTSVER